MGAVPKHKVSRHQRGNRRKHQRLTPPVMVLCPDCGEMKRAHRMCKACGRYRGRQIIAVKPAEE